MWLMYMSLMKLLTNTVLAYKNPNVQMLWITVRTTVLQGFPLPDETVSTGHCQRIPYNDWHESFPEPEHPYLGFQET
jgi:hypothetical protein